jgi:hypothetical protein
MIQDYTRVLGEGTQLTYDLVSFLDISRAGAIGKAFYDYDSGKISIERLNFQLVLAVGGLKPIIALDTNRLIQLERIGGKALGGFQVGLLLVRQRLEN